MTTPGRVQSALARLDLLDEQARASLDNQEGGWWAQTSVERMMLDYLDRPPAPGATETAEADAPHVAAWSPAFTLAATSAMRGVIERHTRAGVPHTRPGTCTWCYAHASWPCPDLRAVLDALAPEGHRDPYCLTHCSPGHKHSQCGCDCDHALSAPARTPSPEGQP